LYRLFFNSPYLDNDYSELRSLEEVVFSFVPGNPELESISLPDYAKRQGKSLGETLCDLLLEQDLAVGYTMPPPASYSLWKQISKDSMELIARDDYMVCLDITPAGTMPHPRSDLPPAIVADPSEHSGMSLCAAA